MTDQRAALVELIERVEKEDLWPKPPVVPLKAHALIRAAFDGDADASEFFIGASDGSVDDALSLLAHLLPGASWRTGKPSGPVFVASVRRPHMSMATEATHPTLPALALLLATLKAYLATLKGDT